ncbi:MAG TPA: NAD(P)H-binding protein [Sandaracinaceae bacterium LLY-WYZ-13_1]|nr:NAD(P)H-binding protein [Sandaracinaceae bacterium LLY-WYZ-13_1]
MARTRIFVAGATGYIGRHAVRELVARGHEVVCLARARSGVGGGQDAAATRASLAGAQVRFGDVTDPASVRDEGFCGERFDAVVSCLASRTGAPADAWAVDHRAQLHVLEAARAAGAGHFVLLSAICVQRPKLAFQRAKLAFEDALVGSGLAWSIVRPTAFHKSLAGQVPRVKAGKPFVVFGDGELTACKPIAEPDLARFLADCLEDPAKRDAVLPVGGPGPAITPRAQGELLFELLGREPRFRHVPVALLDAIIGGLSVAGAVAPPLRAKAELARIGRFYATESMLLWDGDRGYDAEATPSFGTITLRDFYGRVLREGLAGQELGDHAVF